MKFLLNLFLRRNIFISRVSYELHEYLNLSHHCCFIICNQKNAKCLSCPCVNWINPKPRIRPSSFVGILTSVTFPHWRHNLPSDSSVQLHGKLRTIIRVRRCAFKSFFVSSDAWSLTLLCSRPHRIWHAFNACFFCRYSSVTWPSMNVLFGVINSRSVIV